MIEIKNLENEILSKSLRNKEVLFLAESVDVIEEQTNIADVFCEASEEVDDFDVHDFLLDDKSYGNIDSFFHLFFYVHVFGSSSIGTCQTLNMFFYRQAQLKNQNKYSKFDTSKSMSYRVSHSKVGKVILLWRGYRF